MGRPGGARGGGGGALAVALCAVVAFVVASVQYSDPATLNGPLVSNASGRGARALGLLAHARARERESEGEGPASCRVQLVTGLRVEKVGLWRGERS